MPLTETSLLSRATRPALVKLKPGKHTIQLARSGYKDFVSDVIVTTSSIVNVTATLEI